SGSSTTAPTTAASARSTASRARWPNLILVHLPVHASWLNQVEIYHSIIQRKVLDPNDFQSTAEVARALNDFEHRYTRSPSPSPGTSPAKTSPN
ncbi:MAG: hypothetical protein M3R46_01980, partial [Actinomycetota bacterium]|nr:hypothetical protein [Actinomycetota bacterium]